MSGTRVNRPKIALATSWVYPHLGGVSSHISLLADQLGLARHEVICASHLDRRATALLSRIAKRLRKDARKVLNGESISLHALEFVPLFASLDCELLHCHDVMATWAALRARDAAAGRWKVISTVHGPVSKHMIEEGYPPDAPDVDKVRRCERETWRQCDAVIAVDTLQAEIAIEQGADRKKTFIIPNAVDLALLDSVSRALPLSKASDDHWIMVPRRLSPKNGIEVAIKALALMPKKPRLLIAGTGNEKENLQRLVTELGLGQHVVFLGGLDHSALIPLMAASDVVVVPSVPVHGIEEATSLSALEAMALKRPVVASNIGGLKELISSGGNGILVPPKEPSELAGAFEELLGNKDLATRMGNRARETVVNQFSVDLWLERHLSVYSKVLGS